MYGPGKLAVTDRSEPHKFSTSRPVCSKYYVYSMGQYFLRASLAASIVACSNMDNKSSCHTSDSESRAYYYSETDAEGAELYRSKRKGR